MKSLKIKLTTAFIMVAFAIAMLIVGIWAAETQTITMEGSVNFEIADKSLYMKDVRIQMDNNSDPTSIDDFMPGYINGDFKMNLGSLTNNYGSFALYFDIVNTINEETQESFYYSPSVTCEQDGISANVSGAIDKGTATADTVATADISGTIKLVVTNTTDTPVDLSKIKITIYQVEVYTDFVFDDHGTLLSYTGTDTNVIIPSSYAMIGEPEIKSVSAENYDDIVSNPSVFITITNFTFIYNNHEYFFQNLDSLIQYFNQEIPTPCQAFYKDYSNVVFIEGNDIIVTATQGTFAGNQTIQEVTFPEATETIGFYTFYYCSNLRETNINSLNYLKILGHQIFRQCIDYQDNIILKESVKNLIWSTFLESSISSIDLSACINLSYIGTYVLSDCKNLTLVKLPENLRVISRYMFYGCDNLTTITLPSSLTSIGNYAFQDCSKLSNVIIPLGLKTIGYYAFGGSGLTSATFEDPNGWQVGFDSFDSSDFSNPIDILFSDLQDTSKAADYLKSTYRNYYWRKVG